MALLLAISGPLASSLARGGQVNRAVTELGGTLEVARQYAVAQNTYVWVVFAAPDPDAATEIAVAVVASTDGSETPTADAASNPGPATATQWGGVVPTANALVLVAPVRTFPLLALGTAGQVIPAATPPTRGSDLTDSAAFTIRIPGRRTSATFGKAIEFTPSGDARIASGTPVSLIEFDLLPLKGSGVADPKLGVVFQVNGLTGAARVYR